MVVVASFIFAALAALALFAISLSLSGAALQIRSIVSAVYGKKVQSRMRQVKISMPRVHSADIVQFNVPIRRKFADLPEYKVAA